MTLRWNRGHGTCRACCAGWFAKTNRSMIPKRRWHATSDCWFVNDLPEVTAIRRWLDFLVSRYGEFVLLKPPFEKHTLLLWGLPPLALFVGLIWLLTRARRISLRSEPECLSQEEERRLSTLVDPAARDH